MRSVERFAPRTISRSCWRSIGTPASVSEVRICCERAGCKTPGGAKFTVTRRPTVKVQLVTQPEPIIQRANLHPFVSPVLEVIDELAGRIDDRLAGECLERLDVMRVIHEEHVDCKLGAVERRERKLCEGQVVWDERTKAILAKDVPSCVFA
eukprot:2902282-Prymnesium_polylepis.1